MKWSEIEQINQPHNLVSEIQDMKEHCQRILDKKDNLVGEFLASLRSKDEE